MKRGRRIIDRVLGVTGEALVTLGVVLGLFVGWELWWTDLGANRAQADIVANLNWSGTPSASVSGTPGPSPSIANPDVVFPINAPTLVKRTDAPPVLAEPAHATTFATMYVPRWGYDYVRPISQGTDKRGVLDPLGIGHYTGTAMPGGLGNFAVAAHRTTYGKPFNRIEEIQVGKHGILMRNGGSSGLLLPQVATDYGWDRTTFLEQTCHKAGLPRDSWKDSNTEIYIFSADVF